MGVAAAWVALALGITTWAVRAPTTLSNHELLLCTALLGLAMGAGVSSATAVTALRQGLVRVEAGGPPWGVWRRAVLPTVVAVVAGVVPALLFTVVEVANPSGTTLDLASPARHMALWLSAPLSVIAARLLVRAPHAARPVTRTRLRWLVVEGALPPAVIAACVGVVVGVVGFSDVAQVAPGALARTVAGTAAGYLLLALGAHAKAFHEHKRGVVVVDAPPGLALPGPLPVGLGVAALLALVGPWLLPTLPGTDLPIIKGVFGLVVGGGLCFLGAWSGHRRAVLGDG